MTANQILYAIDQERERKEISVRQLGRLAGAKRSRAYESWMRGDRCPTLRSIVHYCNILGLEIKVVKLEDKE